MTQHLKLRDWLKDWIPIHYVRVGGVFQHLSKEDVKQALMPVVNVDFITADLQEIKTTMEALPWVANAEIKRVWPDAIDIKVFEQKPYRRWGQNSLLNERGEIFTLKTTDAYRNLPLLNCPKGQQSRFLEIMKGVEVALSDRELSLLEFNVSDRLAWTLTLNNGLTIKLGNKQPLFNLQRFLKSADILGADRMRAMASVDLRYPNGFAVTWKPGVEIDWGTGEGANV